MSLAAHRKPTWHKLVHRLHPIAW